MRRGKTNKKHWTAASLRGFYMSVCVFFYSTRIRFNRKITLRDWPAPGHCFIFFCISTQRKMRRYYTARVLWPHAWNDSLDGGGREMDVHAMSANVYPIEEWIYSVWNQVVVLVRRRLNERVPTVCGICHEYCRGDGWLVKWKMKVYGKWWRRIEIDSMGFRHDGNSQTVANWFMSSGYWHIHYMIRVEWYGFGDDFFLFWLLRIL